jgi:hypothetical protein
MALQDAIFILKYWEQKILLHLNKNYIRNPSPPSASAGWWTAKADVGFFIRLLSIDTEMILQDDSK